MKPSFGVVLVSAENHINKAIEEVKASLENQKDNLSMLIQENKLKKP